MRFNSKVFTRSALSVCVLLVLNGGLLAAQEGTAHDFNHEPDRLAIEKSTQELIQAFDKRDASAIAAHWIEEGEFIHNDSEPIRGRAEIEKGYAEFFKSLKARPKLEIQSEGLRFPTADMAVTETTLRLRNEEGEIVASGRQNTVLLRQSAQWKLAIVREWDRDTGLDVSLKQLQWLIGTWQAASEERQVTLSYEWDQNQAFIVGKFTVKDGSRIIESGMQMIGKDNAKGVIRSWVFQSDGGFGEEVWTREGRKWSVEVHGVRADGKVLAATNLYIQVDPDTLSWQAVSQNLDGVPLADAAPIQVTRQKSIK